jgi:hypothetical protein
MSRDAVTGVPLQIKVEYQEGYCMIGIPGRYTMRMMEIEFTMLVPTWRIVPTRMMEEMQKCVVIHKILEILPIRIRIQEEKAKETRTILLAEQL